MRRGLKKNYDLGIGEREGGGEREKWI